MTSDEQSNPTARRRRAPSARWLRIGAYGATIALSALAIGACGGDDGGGGNGNSNGAAQSGGGGGSGAEGASQELSVNIGAAPSTMDTLMKTDGPRDQFLPSVQEGLTTRDGQDIVPSIAESWEVDGKTWTFHLREGVKFHNGQDLTSADVVASWKRILSKGSELRGSVVTEDTKVTAPDPMTVEVTRPVVDPTTPVRASQVWIVPADYADLSDSRMSTELIGTGAYKVTDFDQAQGMTLEAFADYWGEQPAIKTVNVKFAEEASVRLAALQAGEIQMAFNMPPDLATDEFKVSAQPVSEVLFMRLNTVHGPFADKRVRQAANMAIDRELLVKSIYSGYAEPTTGQPITEAVFGHSADVEEYPYDPDAAKALMKEAGAEGSEIVLNATRGRWVNDAEVAQAVTGMLNEVGFKVDLQIPPYAEWIKRGFIAETNDDAAPDIHQANHNNALFDSVAEDLFIRCDGAASTMCIDEVESLADEAARITDAPKRQELYDRMWAIIKDDADFVNIANVHQISFLANNLEWESQLIGFVRFQDMQFTS